jgi:hypothetical protein
MISRITERLILLAVGLSIGDLNEANRAERLTAVNEVLSEFFGTFKLKIAHGKVEDTQPDGITTDPANLVKVNSVSWEHVPKFLEPTNLQKFIKALQLSDAFDHNTELSELFAKFAEICPKLRQEKPLSDVQIGQLTASILRFKELFGNLFKADKDTTPYIHILIDHVVEIIWQLPNRFVSAPTLPEILLRDNDLLPLGL